MLTAAGPTSAGPVGHLARCPVCNGISSLAFFIQRPVHDWSTRMLEESTCILRNLTSSSSTGSIARPPFSLYQRDWFSKAVSPLSLASSRETRNPREQFALCWWIETTTNIVGRGKWTILRNPSVLEASDIFQPSQLASDSRVSI